MSDNVAHIFGSIVPELEIDQELVAMAEKFLARCKSGEVQGAAIVWVCGSGLPAHAVEWRADTFCALHSGMVVATNWVTQRLDELSKEPEYDPRETA